MSMTVLFSSIRRCAMLAAGLLLAVYAGGCATATSGLECGMESLNPTVMAAVDSFESAALAIKLSNQVLLEMPISEQDSWPDKLYGAPSGAGLFMMGLSLFASSQGVTIPLEIDPKTGLPRPTSALYIFLKEREQMLAKEVSREDLSFFRSQPPRVIAREIPQYRRLPDVVLIDEHVYRNPLMAFGVVTANREEMVRVQQDLDLLANGFKQCDAWVHASKEGDVKPAACRDPALKQDALQARMKKAVFTEDRPAPEPAAPPVTEQQPVRPPVDLRTAMSGTEKAAPAKKGQVTSLKDRKQASRTKSQQTKKNEPPAAVQSGSSKRSGAVTAAVPDPMPTRPEQPAQGVLYVSERDRQIGEKTEELETMRANYGKLAGRVHSAAVAGADFSMSSIVKISCAIVNGARALPNIENEFKGAKGVYNLAMVVSRVRMIISAFGYYKDNLGLQYTAYTTMYQQIKGTYPELKDPDPAMQQKTARALQRIAQAEAEWRQLEPKLKLIAQGAKDVITDDDLRRLANLARLYPEHQHQQAQQEFLLALNTLSSF